VVHQRKACRIPGGPPSAPHRYENLCALSRAARAPSAARVSRLLQSALRSTPRSALPPVNHSRDKIAFRFWQTKAEGNGKFRSPSPQWICPTARDPLFNRNSGRQSANQIDVGLFKLLDELPRVRRHAVEKAPLPFGEQNVECEG